MIVSLRRNSLTLATPTEYALLFTPVDLPRFYRRGVGSGDVAGPFQERLRLRR